MKINRIKIDDFRNLKNFEIHFSSSGKDADGNVEHFNSHAIIGQNGSGKSNLLEAIITIFRDLDLKNKAEFGYEIDYTIRGHEIIVAAQAGSLASVIIDKTKSSATFLSEHAAEYLPSNVFVYYSGKNNRVEELFQAHQKKFNDTLRKDGDDLIRRLFFCRSGHSQLVLLACMLSKDPVFKKILEKLNIEELDSALFVLKQPYCLKQNLNENDVREGDQRFWFAKGTVVSEFLNKLWRWSVAPIDDNKSIQIDFRGRVEDQKQIYLYLPDKESLQELGKEVGPPEVFFRYAEGAYIGDLIDEIRITIKTKNNNETLELTQLSEGEMQLLTVIGLMQITSKDHCLFLLDEPDTHLNPIWKLRFFEEINAIVKKNQQGTSKGEAQIIITTHDPLMVGSLRKEQVRILQKSMDGSTEVSEPDTDPQGMGFAGLLKSELFGLRSTVDSDTLRRLDRRNELYAKGKQRSSVENTEMSRLSAQLADLGFAKDFKDPLYAQFVQKMAIHTKFHQEILTPELQNEQDVLADSIIDEILSKDNLK